MQFSTIIAQEPVKKQLAEMMQSNRLAHALLFLGKEGSGALQLAIAFAQYVVCEKTGGKQSTNQQSGPSLFGEAPTSNIEHPNGCLRPAERDVVLGRCHSAGFSGVPGRPFGNISLKRFATGAGTSAETSPPNAAISLTPLDDTKLT